MIDFFIFHYLSSFTAKRTKRYRLPTGRLAGRRTRGRYVVFKESVDGAVPLIPDKSARTAGKKPLAQQRLSEFGDRLVREHFAARMDLLTRNPIAFDGAASSAEAAAARNAKASAMVAALTKLGLGAPGTSGGGSSGGGSGGATEAAAAAAASSPSFADAHAWKFVEAGVEPQQLPVLTHEVLVDHLKMSVGPALKLLQAVQDAASNSDV